MSDTQFDGKRIFQYMSAALAATDLRAKAIYDIRGKYIHKPGRGTRPDFEIRGNDIHFANRASSAVYEIRGTVRRHLEAQVE